MDESDNEEQKLFEQTQWKRFFSKYYFINIFICFSVLALSSWDQFVAGDSGSTIEASLKDRTMSLPWEFRNRLFDSEMEMFRLFELRQRRDFASASGYGRVSGRNANDSLLILQV